MSGDAHGVGFLLTAAVADHLSQVLRVLTLRDYNTRVVVLGTMLLGVAAGLIGTFMLLRKRALMGDTISHATLPGIGLAFIVMTALGGEGKALPGLLLGAVLSSAAGIGCMLAIRHGTRLKDDVALGAVLSVFFGLGVAVLGIVQSMSRGNAAGLESFIYGKTASMLAHDAAMIAVAAGLVALVCGLLFKEFALVCFDQEFAAAGGWPVLALDAVMVGLVVAVTVIGLQAVGLILIVALLITPPAAARFWTDRLSRMLVAAATIGAVSGLAGAMLSALLPHLPAGAIIVIVAGAIFGVSLVVGPRRGVLVRLREHLRLRRTVARQHLLRAMYERIEVIAAPRMETAVSAARGDGTPVPWSALLKARSWSQGYLRRLLRRGQRWGLVEPAGPDLYRLTAAGAAEAARVSRNHRLWEMYLITHADVAPSHVDRDADQIEHVLGREMVAQLEALMVSEASRAAVPPSPHAIERGCNTAAPESSAHGSARSEGGRA